MSQIPLEAENEFYAAMEREDAEQLEREARAAASARLNALALQLKREFSTAESSRRLIEERWLEDLMQYRGQYPADVMERLKKFKRSQVYYRMTTNKVDMMVARLMDLLFPARSKNWAIQPTPDPEIPGELVEQSPEFMQAVQEVMAEQMQLLQAQNAVPDDLAMRKMQQMAMQEAMRRIDLDTVKLRIAKACADKMEQVIDDQLKESSAGGEFRPSWQQHCKAVIFSSCLLGMGVLKGPLVERRELRKRRPVSDASGRVVWDEQVMGEERRWTLSPVTMGRMPRLSMPSTAPVQGVVGGLSSPVAQPAGGIPMQAPRGDTTAQAERLGMRAPDTVPEDFLLNHIIVGTVPSPAPASRSERHSSVPSVVPSPAGMAAGQQHAGQVPAVQEQARKRLEGMTRRELLALVPQKELPAARKEKNKNSLIERILASEFAAGTGESSLSGKKRGVDSGQKEEGHAGIQQGTPGIGVGELLSESVPVDAAENPGKLDTTAGNPGDFQRGDRRGDRGSGYDMDTAVPGTGGAEAGPRTAVQRAAGHVALPRERGSQNVLLHQLSADTESGRPAEGRGGQFLDGRYRQMGQPISRGSKGEKKEVLEKTRAQGVERKLFRAIERQQGGVFPRASCRSAASSGKSRKRRGSAGCGTGLGCNPGA